ncbi:MAG: hypothetical protein IPO21_20060 [Bacteroidales bacterium]|nr:hypothetical protein [Bacteroidales bacterium]
MVRLLLVSITFLCFSCRVPDDTSIKLFTLYDNGDVAPESRVHLYIDSEDKSYLALDTFIVTNNEGWLLLAMPGECYIDVLAINDNGESIYAGKQQVHLIENKQTIDTIHLFDSNK